MASPHVFVQEIHRLTEHLYRVLQEQVGSDQTELFEHVLQLARARREDDGRPGAELEAIIGQLSQQQIEVVLWAIAILFDLINMAEDRHRVRVLHDRERRSGDRPRPESIGAALEQLHREGYTAAQIQGFLDRLSIEPVFTAHPTEAKRRTVRTKLRAISGHLAELDAIDLLPREVAARERAIHGELVSLWQTDPHRPERPTVLEEVERSLFFMSTIWEVVPRLYRDLEEGLQRYFPGSPFHQPRFLHFGSWIGGDRDGNPFVSRDVTAQTLTMLRRAALERHLEESYSIYRQLSMSVKRWPVSPALEGALAEAMGRWPQLEKRLQRISAYEVYRRWLQVVEWRLKQTLVAAPFAEPPVGAYRRPADLEADIQLVHQSLNQHNAGVLAETAVEDWLCRIRVFGFHLARLDIRQESSYYAGVVAELMARLGLCVDYLDLDEEQRQALLVRTMGAQDPLATQELSEETQDTLALFRLMARSVQLHGVEILGSHVVSMTHAPSDVLVVLWLLRWAAAEIGGEQPLGVGTAGIVPLFETIDDLHGAAAILDALLSDVAYAAHLQASGGVQTVMVGYSDSTKDGGYLTASWGLYQGQVELHAVAQRHGVQLVFFHGRGGSLGRGGGPAARSIRSLPPHTVGGAIRTTEQGEVLAARYDDPEIAFRHLEQITAATFLVEAKSGQAARPEWAATMERLSGQAWSQYRELVEYPGFVAYFRQATPIDEIENLPIGSRPARRRAQEHSLATLRAIPWVFAWTQSRVLLPAWYGMGAALEDFAGGDEAAWTDLARMYEEWAYFRGTVDNAALALAKADMEMARNYVRLVEDQDSAQVIWRMIEAEYERTCTAVLRMTGRRHLLENISWLQRSIDERDPFVDPLNLIQVEFLGRLRALDEGDAGPEEERLRDLLRLTIQGIAGGMRTTG
ncbi:MAG: phosphoenolpyruvate carboxylase [Candidatus Latescibacteria bacterium]|nr:phosphoenolpyruvate carboxylase [Candidatus Latescibacterota bacterium]